MNSSSGKLEKRRSEEDEFEILEKYSTPSTFKTTFPKEFVLDPIKKPMADTSGSTVRDLWPSHC